MRHKMDSMPLDPSDRAGEVVDLLSHARAGGRSKGLHHLMGVLAKTDKGPMPHLANVLLILAHDPPLAGMLGYNEFKFELVMNRAPPPMEDNGALLPGPYPRPWGTEDVVLIQAYLQRNWSHRINRETTESAMLAEAHRMRFHPVRDWLDTLRWDGIKRIDTWLISAFACEDKPFHRAVGAKFLIAAVRRIRRPGVKFDQLLVLEGSQGIGKSKSLAALFGPDWFSDSLPTDLSNRDAAIALHGLWGLELAEIEQLIRAEVETVKAFLSRSVDRYRPINGKSFVERPRHGVMVGTTNSRDYLRDSTGNRRFWPVLCQAADDVWIALNREQLWAEACEREATGETIWLDMAVDQVGAVDAQEQRLTEDVWTDALRLWLGGKAELSTASALSEALQIPKERQGRREQVRCAAILRSEGWEQSIERKGSKIVRIWRPKAPDRPLYKGES